MVKNWTWVLLIVIVVRWGGLFFSRIGEVYCTHFGILNVGSTLIFLQLVSLAIIKSRWFVDCDHFEVGFTW